MKKEKKYILQGNDMTCQLVTLLNFLIYKKGKSPIKYRSKEFNSIIRECTVTISGAIYDIKPALKILNLSLKKSPKFKSLKRFKNWIIRELDKGNCIDFCFYHPRSNLHSVLIVGYDKYHEGFKVINTQMFTNETSIEYLSWEELTKRCYNRNPRIYPYYNKEEKTGLITKLIIDETFSIKLKK